MNIIDLTSELITAFPKIPVFYNHIVVEEGQELTPPYIVTNSEETSPFHADNCNYFSFVRNTVSLYVGKLTERNLQMLDKFFNARNIPFSKKTTFDEFSYCYEIEYTVSLEDIEVTQDGNDNP